MKNRSYLVHHRKRWALSQRELARLLGHRSRSTVSRLETRGGSPSLRLVIGCQILFGVRFAELFPSLYEDHRDQIMRRAARLDARLRNQKGTSADRKRELLADLVRRMPNAPDA